MHTDNTTTTPAFDTTPIAPAYAPVEMPASALAPVAEPVALSTFGHEAAARHGRFVGYYSVMVTERGVIISAPSPDGRYTGSCDRCCTAIRHVYVFRSTTTGSYMHVGCDCAQRMGIPVAELKAASRAARDANHLRATAAERAARAARHATEQARIAAERAAREDRHAALLEELGTLASDPRASSFERSRLEQAMERVRCEGDFTVRRAFPRLRTRLNDDGQVVEYVDGYADERDDRTVRLAADVESARVRLALCNTSRASDAAQLLAQARELAGYGLDGARAVQATRAAMAATVKGVRGLTAEEKAAAKGHLTLTLEAYRDPYTTEGPHGTVYRSYLRDATGTAYTYRGSKPVRAGERVTATWTLKGASTYDGLVSTELSRPRDGTITRFLPTDEWPVEYTADPEGTGEIIAVLVPAYATPADW